MDIKVSLPEELLDYIRSKVDSGDYRSSSAVVEEALMLLEERDTGIAEIQGLRKAWQEGRDSGDFAPLDVDAIKREGRARLTKLA
jgi:antitoxin ParD1/3/4